MNKVGVCIGHNSKKHGAYSKANNQCEFAYYKDVVEELKKLDKDNIFDYFERDSNAKSYGQEMRGVLEEMNGNGENYQLIIELHFNAAGNPDVKGAEILCYEKSRMGVPLSRELLNRLCKEFDLKNRGIKGIKNANERGGYGIMKSSYPYILIEPFFCSNVEEDKKFTDKAKLAKVIYDFVKEM